MTKISDEAFQEALANGVIKNTESRVLSLFEGYGRMTLAEACEVFKGLYPDKPRDISSTICGLRTKSKLDIVGEKTCSCTNKKASVYQVPEVPATELECLMRKGSRIMERQIDLNKRWDELRVDLNSYSPHMPEEQWMALFETELLKKKP